MEDKKKFTPRSRATYNMGELDFKRYDTILQKINAYKGLVMSHGVEYLDSFIGAVYELYDEWFPIMSDETKEKAEKLMAEIENYISSMSPSSLHLVPVKIKVFMLSSGQRGAYRKTRQLHRLLMTFRQNEAQFGMKTQTQQSPSSIIRRGLGIPDKVSKDE